MAACEGVGLVEESLTDLTRDELPHGVEIAVKGTERLFVCAGSTIFLSANLIQKLSAGGVVRLRRRRVDQGHHLWAL